MVGGVLGINAFCIIGWPFKQSFKNIWCSLSHVHEWTSQQITDKPLFKSRIVSHHRRATSHYCRKQKVSLQAAALARAHRSAYLFRRLAKLAFRPARRWVHFDTEIHQGALICLWCRTQKGCTRGQVKETQAAGERNGATEGHAGVLLLTTPPLRRPAALTRRHFCMGNMFRSIKVFRPEASGRQLRCSPQGVTDGGKESCIH